MNGEGKRKGKSGMTRSFRMDGRRFMMRAIAMKVCCQMKIAYVLYCGVLAAMMNHSEIPSSSIQYSDDFTTCFASIQRLPSP